MTYCQAFIRACLQPVETLCDAAEVRDATATACMARFGGRLSLIMSADSPVISPVPVQEDLPTLASVTFSFDRTDQSFILDALRHQALVWTRQGNGLVGLGSVARVKTRGEDRFLQARNWFSDVVERATVIDPINRPGSGPVAFGAFSFSYTSCYESRLVVPEIIFGKDGDKSWITLTSSTLPATELSYEFAMHRAQQLLAEASFAGAAHGSISLLPGQLTAGAYLEAVSEALEVLEGEQISKLVLSRDVIARSSGGIDLADVLQELIKGYDNCWTYAVDGLVGATPEMLVRVTNGKAEARVLAGTLDRATAPVGDTNYPHRELFEDPKQRVEHQLAIDSLTLALDPISHGMSAPEQPFILELPNVWHLASDVSAQLRPGSNGRFPSALDIAEAFHPTAAVCGTPTKEAGVALRELEGLDRGPYAGPVGWIDSRGDGEFGIALRGGVLEDESTMRLYAGCGIVTGSDPESELAESWAKMRPMLQALHAER